MQVLQAGVAINEDSGEAHNMLGVAYQSLKQYDKAIASFKKALELKGDLYDAIYNLGMTYAATDSRKEARGDAQPLHQGGHAASPTSTPTSSAPPTTRSPSWRAGGRWRWRARKALPVEEASTVAAQQPRPAGPHSSRSSSEPTFSRIPPAVLGAFRL